VYSVGNLFIVDILYKRTSCQSSVYSQVAAARSKWESGSRLRRLVSTGLNGQRLSTDNQSFQKFLINSIILL